MKRCLLLALVLTVSPAFAQDSNKLDAQLLNDRKTQNPALEKKIPRAQGRTVPIGAVYMMSKNGFQVINPMAPAKYGSGAQNVTKGIGADKIPGMTEDYVNPLGGIILFGWAF